MKKIYRYIEIIVISILTVFMFTMCTNSKSTSEENAVVQIEDDVNEINEIVEVE